MTFKTRVKQQLLCFIYNMFSSLVLFLSHISKVKNLCDVIQVPQASIPPLTPKSQFLSVTEGHYLSSGNKRKADKYSTYTRCIGDMRLPRILKESQLVHLWGKGIISLQIAANLQLTFYLLACKLLINITCTTACQVLLLNEPAE